MRWDSDCESIPSPSTSTESLEEEEVNFRLKPYWQKYKGLFKSRGLHLETVRDARPVYKRLQSSSSNHCIHNSILTLLRLKEGSKHDQDLFPDPSLPDNLFRGQRKSDGKRFIVKAVHSLSREYDIVRVLSCQAFKGDPQNHAIPVIDIFESAEDRVGFIVMEQWFAQPFDDSNPCCAEGFVMALRQLLEHIVFMHRHRYVHFDIAIANVVTNQQGRYAFIDFELSRKFEAESVFRSLGHRAAEIPPECEGREYSDPFKVDVWALGVLILRACKMTGYHIPEVLQLTQPMLHDTPEQRPSAHAVLETFDRMLHHVRPRLGSGCITRH